ncbi:cupin domain-containing protein [Mycobacterium sp. 663a-19]|uniref:cupin domain-containing protein n=1 Tax=Mycobacterium sp. 663a-19 TaxID=2986148 RepID=UPI002D1E9842|nr:cupin domain-containing protein [Mycobacterium sp. 663a-19]MEB3980075.1 cupin domain-containing protein [Mycobacterium sp. 663a-19]
MTSVTSEDEAQLYDDFITNGLVPLWSIREDLMPTVPKPNAVPHLWRWNELYSLAQRAGELIPVGRGGERRAIAMANPGLGGLPYATPTLWAAIQYLAPGEVAPSHRHSQNAFRFVLEGEGVWTVVDGDPVAMRRGDLLLTAGWQFHAHHNPNSQPMAWLDGLDVPFAAHIDAEFFEFGAAEPDDRTTPKRSRSERLWGHPALRPVSDSDRDHGFSPLAAYRWEHTDAALRAQLELEAAGHHGVVSAGHAAVRFTNPTTGADALPTIRTEMHRIAPGATTLTTREAGSSVWQVFDGTGSVILDDQRRDIERGDVFAVPSWCAFRLVGDAELTLFRMSDAPIFELLRLNRKATT